MSLNTLFVATVAGMAAMVMGVQHASAAQVVLPLTAFGQATTPNGDDTGFTVSAGGDPIYSEYNVPAAAGIAEEQGVLEFSLASLPAGAVLTSVQLNFYVQLFEETVVGSTTLYPNIYFYGYAGNNAINASDAGQGGKVSLNQFNDPYSVEFLGADSVFLDTLDVQALVSTNPSALGIMLWNGATNVSAAFATTGDNAPTLVIDYVAVPEPTTLGLVAAASILGCYRRRPLTN